MLGGWLGDYCARFSRQSYLWVSGLSTLAAVPFAIVALTAPQPVLYLGATAVASALIFISTGPINTTIVNVVSPHMRATAVAGSTLAIHLFGDAASPFVVGALSDRFSLASAVLIVPFMLALGGLIWIGTAWSERHRERGGEDP